MTKKELNKRILLKLTGEDKFTFFNKIFPIKLDKEKEHFYTSLISHNGDIIAPLYVHIDEDIYIEYNEIFSTNIISFLQKYKLRAKIDWQLQKVDRVFSISENMVYNFPYENPIMHRICTHDQVSYFVNKCDITEFENNFMLYFYRNLLPMHDEIFFAHKLYPINLLHEYYGALNFTKGCFIGQEVAARMKNISKARKFIKAIETNEKYTDKLIINDILFGSIISGSEYKVNSKYFYLAIIDEKKLSSFFEIFNEKIKIFNKDLLHAKM